MPKKTTENIRVDTVSELINILKKTGQIVEWFGPYLRANTALGERKPPLTCGKKRISTASSSRSFNYWNWASTGTNPTISPFCGLSPTTRPAASNRRARASDRETWHP